MSHVPGHFGRWLREARGGPSEPGSQAGSRVLELSPLGRGTPFRWISYADSARECRLPVTVDLWALRETPTTRAGFGEICGSLELANCRCDEVTEALVVRGFAASRFVVLRANLVCPSVEPDSLLAEVAQSGSRVRLWAYSLSPSGFDVFPHCPAPLSDTERGLGPLAGLFSKLSRPVKRGISRMAVGGLSGERRRFERRPVCVRASVAIAGADRRIIAKREATISDLSTRGACLTGIPLHMGLGALKTGKVVLRSAMGGKPFFARGRVVRFNVQNTSTTLAIEFSGRPRVG